ncbi:unnamed protein product, partial [Mesorhabditis spiculigera]
MGTLGACLRLRSPPAYSMEQPEITVPLDSIRAPSGMKRATSENSGGSTGESSGHNTPENDEQPFPPHKRLLSGADDKGESDTEELRQRMNGCAREPIDLEKEEKIAILDFGAQYGKVIDRRVRENKVLSEMFPLSTSAKEILGKGHFKGIIISGGPNSVYAATAASIDPEIFTCGLPVLGICYGFQLLNKWAGGGVGREKVREDGQTIIQVDPECTLFKGLQPLETVLLTHGDSVNESTVAAGFKVVAKSGQHVAGLADEGRKLYGVQFHPEVDLTLHGHEMFKNFLYEICKCHGGYTMQNREEMCISEIKQTVGAVDKVLVLVSGGVDSAVCAALLHKALGKDRVTAIHIDNGFMRYNESDNVIASLNALNLNVYRYNCWPEFYSGTINNDHDKRAIKLDQTIDPEIKRQIIGNTFIRVKDRIMKDLKLKPEEYFLAQGTLRPDLIESASALASGHADAIKTHHNDTALVRELRKTGRVIEPLKDFHKDEVRELGKDLGLPEAIVHRQPFPGPGLAIRIICAENPYKCDDFLETQANLQILANIAKECKTEEDIKRRFALTTLLAGWMDLSTLVGPVDPIHTTLLPVRTVGVQGDSRSYSYVAALSCKTQPIPWLFFEKLAALIPKVLHNINRVVYVFGNPIRHDIEKITVTHLTRQNVLKLQMADKLANECLFGSSGNASLALSDVSRKIQQMPVVMLPIHFDRDPLVQPTSYQHSFCLRPFITADFMTGRAALPGRDIPEENVLMMEKRILSGVPSTSRSKQAMSSKCPLCRQSCSASGVRKVFLEVSSDDTQQFPDSPASSNARLTAKLEKVEEELAEQKRKDSEIRFEYDKLRKERTALNVQHRRDALQIDQLNSRVLRSKQETEELRSMIIDLKHDNKELAETRQLLQASEFYKKLASGRNPADVIKAQMPNDKNGVVMEMIINNYNAEKTERKRAVDALEATKRELTETVAKKRQLEELVRQLRAELKDAGVSSPANPQLRKVLERSPQRRDSLEFVAGPPTDAVINSIMRNRKPIGTFAPARKRLNIFDELSSTPSTSKKAKAGSSQDLFGNDDENVYVPLQVRQRVQEQNKTTKEAVKVPSNGLGGIFRPAERVLNRLAQRDDSDSPVIRRAPTLLHKNTRNVVAASSAQSIMKPRPMKELSRLGNDTIVLEDD